MGTTHGGNDSDNISDEPNRTPNPQQIANEEIVNHAPGPLPIQYYSGRFERRYRTVGIQTQVTPDTLKEMCRNVIKKKLAFSSVVDTLQLPATLKEYLKDDEESSDNPSSGDPVLTRQSFHGDFDFREERRRKIV